MDADIVIKLLENFGPLGIVAGIMIWQNIRTTAKLIQIVETNTKALAEMRDVIERICDRLKN